MIPAIAIVGGNIPIAAGAGAGGQAARAAAPSPSCFFGDGATNEGAFHEGLNMAAIWDLPVVFVCENNLYAASTPVREAFKIAERRRPRRRLRHAGRHRGRQRRAGGLRGRCRAIDRARRGEGPTLLECKTYRLCGHSRCDPRTYRTKEEEAEWQQRDPILRLAA